MVRMISALAGLAILGAALTWALRPQPVIVTTTPVTRGALAVTVAGEGITRVRERWSITAPVTGHALRAPVETGDRVTGGETVVAIIEPGEPAFLDARSRRLAEVSVVEARAAVALAAANLDRWESELTHLTGELERTRLLAARGVASPTVLEDAQQAVAMAKATREVAYYELEQARATEARMAAQLASPGLPREDGEPGACCLRLTAPRSGTVLEVLEDNAGLVSAGTPLLTLGDLSELEVEVDLLSTDAVDLATGAPATIERWGGPKALEARVRRIDPSAFTHISALGIEEQRVTVHLDLLAPPEMRPGLGDRFRVFVRIVRWAGDDLLQVPRSALFRHGGGWAVFIATEGKALLRPIRLGHSSEDQAEVLSGLQEGEAVIPFPSPRLVDGAAIKVSS